MFKLFPFKRKMPIVIRWMVFNQDIQQVLDIERKSFEFLWTEENFYYCYERKNCAIMVAERAKAAIAGFMAYERRRRKILLLNFAVHPDCRRRGVGKQMIDMLIKIMDCSEKKAISLNVRETNLHAQLFFREMGFKVTDILHNFYDDTTEDAYLMQYPRKKQKERRVVFQGKNRISGFWQKKEDR